MPLAGDPLDYNPDLWNEGATDEQMVLKNFYLYGENTGFIQYYTNCYSYAFNLRKNIITGQRFSLIGMQTGMFSSDPNDYYYLGMKGDELIEIIKADAYELGYYFEKVEPGDELAEGTWLVALIYGTDYHWFRQNPDGTWSHKPGLKMVRDYDAYGNTIYDPEKCKWKECYTDFAGYFMVGPKN